MAAFPVTNTLLHFQLHFETHCNWSNAYCIAPAPSTEPPVDLAKKCDTSACELPYCFCSRDGTHIPGDLDPEDVSSTAYL